MTSGRIASESKGSTLHILTIPYSSESKIKCSYLSLSARLTTDEYANMPLKINIEIFAYKMVGIRSNS